MTDHSETIKRLDTDKLIDIVRNYRQYNYDDRTRQAALDILRQRGINEEELKLTGRFENETYNEADRLYSAFRHSSRIAFVFYAVLLIIRLSMNFIPGSFEGYLLPLTTWGLFFLFAIFLIRSFIYQSQFYKKTGEEYGIGGALMYLLLGMPLYMIMFFYFNHQMNEQMKYIR